MWLQFPVHEFWDAQIVTTERYRRGEFRRDK